MEEELEEKGISLVELNRLVRKFLDLLPTSMLQTYVMRVSRAGNEKDERQGTKPFV